MKKEIAGQVAGNLLGPWTAGDFISALIFATIGAVLLALLHTTKRDVTSPGSPVQFDWKFFLCDNAKRFTAAALIILVSIRFLQPLITLIGVKQDNMLVSLFIGAISDFLGLGFQALVRRYGKRVVALAEEEKPKP
jgi:hypothetical protein